MLVIRVWIEPDNRNQLRARITRSLDITTTDQVLTAAASIESICDTVRDWLEVFVAPAQL